MNLIQNIETLQDNTSLSFLNDSTSDMIKGQQMYNRIMNSPGDSIYIADPDPTFNCTQLIDTKTKIEKELWPKIRFYAGDSVTILSRVNGAVNNKLRLYEQAIQQCTPAPLPDTPFTPTNNTPAQTTLSNQQNPITNKPDISKNSNPNIPTQQPPTQSPASMPAAAAGTKKYFIIGGIIIAIIVATSVVLLRTSRG